MSRHTEVPTRSLTAHWPNATHQQPSMPCGFPFGCCKGVACCKKTDFGHTPVQGCGALGPTCSGDPGSENGYDLHKLHHPCAIQRLTGSGNDGILCRARVQLQTRTLGGCGTRLVCGTRGGSGTLEENDYYKSSQISHMKDFVYYQLPLSLQYLPL